jgi:hypothetical protein
MMYTDLQPANDNSKIKESFGLLTEPRMKESNAKMKLCSETFKRVRLVLLLRAGLCIGLGAIISPTRLDSTSYSFLVLFFMARTRTNVYFFTNRLEVVG